ncbi:MFS transporter [Bauldia sp.]|uniref:MFS transporter n=1 Tax=Bauldia sp. TaxID=2575872 RepID=UPI0025BE24DC|nr:MFS transporter [Bauldia sp.]
MTVTSRWVFLALSSLAVVLSLTAWFSATAVMPDLVARWNLGAGEGAWLTNAVQIGFVVGALGASFFGLPDRVAPQRLMAMSATVAGVATWGMLVAPGLAAAVALRLVTGIALAGVYPPSMQLMATWFQKGRGVALGTLIGALTLGSATPHLIRGLGGGLDWRLVLIAAGAMGLASALISAFALHQGPHPFMKRAKVHLGQVGTILLNRPVMLANLGYFGHMWELYAMWAWFLAYGRAAAGAGLDLGNASVLTFVIIAAGVPGCIVGGLLSDRIGRTYTTALMMSLSGLSALAIGFTFDGPVWLFALVAMVWGFTVIADSAQFSAAVTELSPPEIVGSALAFQMGIGFALTTITIWAVPLLAGMAGWQWAFVVLAPGPFLGVWSMLTLRRLPEAARMAQGAR